MQLTEQTWLHADPKRRSDHRPSTTGSGGAAEYVVPHLQLCRGQASQNGRPRSGEDGKGQGAVVVLHDRHIIVAPGQLALRVHMEGVGAACTQHIAAQGGSDRVLQLLHVNVGGPALSACFCGECTQKQAERLVACRMTAGLVSCGLGCHCHADWCRWAHHCGRHRDRRLRSGPQGGPEMSGRVQAASGQPAAKSVASEPCDQAQLHGVIACQPEHNAC